MVIGRYRVTRRGYVVFGSTGIVLLVILAMLVTQIIGQNQGSQPNGDKPGSVQSESTGTTGGNSENSNTGTSSNSGTSSTSNSGTGSSGQNAADTALSREEVNNILATASCTIYFKPDDYVLNEDFYSQLDKVVEMSKRFKDAKIILDGHFNGIPGNKSTEFRVALAQNRAEMVEAYLISQGVDSARVTINNLGCKVPVNKDDSWEEIQKNRRVEVYFKSLE